MIILIGFWVKALRVPESKNGKESANYFVI